MKRTFFILSIIFLSGSFSSSICKRELNNTFYCFNNAVRELPNAPKEYEAQAELVKNLGYDGLAGKGEENYFEFRKALDKVGLAMPDTYIEFKVEPGMPNYNPLLKDIIKDAEGRDLLITLHLHSEFYKNNKDEGDKKFSEALTNLADYAAEYDVKLAVYPHINFYCEKTDHVLKLVKMVNRPNVGAVFNLCHFLKIEGEDQLEVQVKKALPYLFMVSINGAESGDTKNMTWEQLIQPLGEGSFDNYKFIKLLKDNGYDGRIGLQCYNIKQDCTTALTKSINAWNSYKKKYVLEK